MYWVVIPKRNNIPVKSSQDVTCEEEEKSFFIIICEL